MPKDLHELPRLCDSISYISIEKAIIEQEDSSIVIVRDDGNIPIPVSSLTCLLLGPGTSITHAAMKTIADNGCMVVWCGENTGCFYASGMGETRSADNLLLQAKLCMDPEAHMAVVRKMYEIRFPTVPTKTMTLQQIRGMEGIRVKETYKVESKRTGVKWSGRDYKKTEWEDSDDINKALSMSNAILYSVCHAAIVSLGFSPGLGFVHTGKMLSFVYDIADLYKTETTIPAAFEAVRDAKGNLEEKVKLYTRQKIAKARILKRVADDIEKLFQTSMQEEHQNREDAGEIWDTDGRVIGGRNYGGDLK
ncbi:MAG: type I-E CRISPR-associated endonuclease Cas1e [Lachnospiraceae bacterium]|nr:type I-E CRISPR-associated endonuclease Cas1e [Lachnospiraceae bacterium]